MPTRIPRRSADIKKLIMPAKRKGVDLWFEDECHFQQRGSRCAMWVPPEEADPVLLHAPTRKSIAVFGAVRPVAGRLVVAESDVFNADTFLVFLKQLLRHRKRNRLMVIVTDNARYHRAKALRGWLHEHRNAIRLDYLPPYSPEFNYIERVWKITRRTCTHNRYFPELEQLIKAVFKQFSLWAEPNSILQRLCAIIQNAQYNIRNIRELRRIIFHKEF